MPFSLALAIRRLIILNSGTISKENFYNRALVVQVVTEIVRRGDVLCPACHGFFKVHGSYERHLKDELGGRHDGWVAQVHCQTCNKYPSLAPDFVMPYKHYMGAVIEAVLIASEENDQGSSFCPADDSTMQRWVNQFRERGARAAGWLLSILFMVYGQFISALDQQNMSLLKRLAYLTQQFPVSETGVIIGRVNIILTRHGRGFL